jgi:olefin beta-lactone synthetase
MRTARELGIAPELYPFEGHRFDQGGIGQHYLDEGPKDAPAVVMVHGNPTWSFYYRALVLALRDDFRCIVPDHIGCGLSDMPGQDRYDFRLASRIDDLERLIEHLVPDGPIHLVVHDWGGMIGMGYAVRHPERIARIVVSNTAAFHLPEHMRVPAPVAVVRDTAVAGWFVRGFNAFARGASETCCTRRRPPARVRDALCAPYDSWQHRLATLAFVRDIPLRPSDPSYPTVTAVEQGLAQLRNKSMMLCWGAKDFVFDLRVLAEWRKRFPEARVEEFGDSGHYLLEDAPLEMARLVRGFLGQAEAREPGPVVNIARVLPEIASRDPERVAIQVPVGGGYRPIRYRELDEDSDVIAAGLIASGIGRGVRTALMVKPSADFFALSFGIAKAGAVPVLIDPGIGPTHLGRCLAEARPQAFIGIAKAHAARVALGWGRDTVLTNVSVGSLKLPGTISLDDVRRRGRAHLADFTMAPTRGNELAAILFTSGSTGPPKGAAYTHGNFDAQIRLLRAISGLGEGEIDLPTFPVFALFDPALGMTTVIPDMDPTRPADVDPDAIIGPVQRFGATNMFASPALLERVSQHAQARDVVLPSLRRVVSAGAPVHAEVMDRFLAMMGDGAQILTPYGATEALPVALIGSDELRGLRHIHDRGVCIGRPVPETTVAIIEIDDGPIDRWSDARPLPAGEVGEIVVAGPQVTSRYFGRPEADQLAKIRDGARVRHRMGDVGLFDDEGRLWFCGRKAHRVQTFQRTMFTVPCEVVFNAHAAVYRSALVGPRVGDRVSPTIVVELRPGARGGRATVNALLALAQEHPHTRPIRRVLFHPRFPVDIRHNAKIDRPALTRWAEARLR